MFVRLAIYLSLGALATKLTAAVPYECDIENGFDYVGHDVGSVQSSDYTTCCNSCFMSANCNAWTWTNYNGGTCWLKKDVDPDSVVVNSGAKSARVLLGMPFPHCRLYNNVDFAGNDIGTAKATVASDCCDICRNTAGCRHYSWNNYDNGTCWLKSARGATPIVNVGATSGDAFDNRDVVYAVETGVDYVDHDISNAAASSVEACVTLVKAAHAKDTSTSDAFSWSNYNGGTCWIKSTKNETITSTGVTSGYLA